MRIVRLVLTTLLAATCVAVVGWLVAMRIHHNLFLSVQTGSMSPAIRRGDLVLVRHVPVSDIKIGDVITYANPLNTRITITHRVIATPDILKRPEFLTKGDANRSADEPVNAYAVTGRVVKIVPYAGRVMNFLMTPLGIATIIYLPALVVVASEIRRLALYYRKQQAYVFAGRDFSPASNFTPKRRVPRVLLVPLLVLLLLVAQSAYAGLRSSSVLAGTSISTVKLT